MSQEKNADVKTLLHQILDMPVKAQRALLDELALGLQSAQTKGGDRDLAMWSAAVYDVLKRQDSAALHGSGGVVVLRKLLGDKKAWATVQDFIKAAQFDQLAVTQRQAAFDMLAMLLLEHAASVSEYTNAPMSLKFLINQIPALPAYFERQFPGYLLSGMALLPFKRWGHRGQLTT